MRHSISREDAKVGVGPGWAGLIDRFYDRLPDDVDVMDVKEKYGGLRIYTFNASKELEDLISILEKESFHTCEICGGKAEVRKNNCWLETLCDYHYNMKKR